MALNRRNAVSLMENGIVSLLIEALLDGDVASLTKQSAVDLLWTRTLNQMSQSIWETWPWSFPMHK